MIPALIRSSLFVGMLSLVSTGATAASNTVSVFKSASCGCCGKWVEHLRQNGFDVDVKNVSDVSAVRARLGMPDKLASCHTAQVAGYVVEGHVPAQDIKKLIANKPKALGIAIPGMPPGSPGMESPKPLPFNTLLVQADGSHRVFATH